MKTKERIKDIERQGKEELSQNLKEKQERLRRLRFDLASGKVKNIREIRQERRDIARIFTFLKLKKTKA